MGGKTLHVPKPFSYIGRRQRRAQNIASGIAGAGGMALAKYGYDKMFKKPVNLTKAVAKAIKPFQQARMARRPRGNATKSRNVIPKGDESQGGYAQWTQRYQQATFGKLTPVKVDKLSNDTLTLRHQLIGPFNDYGQRWMWNANLVNGDQYYPLMLFELNSTNNYSGGILKSQVPVHQLYQPTGTSTLNWLTVNCQNTDGTAPLAAWVPEKSGHTATAVSTHPMSKAIHKWSSLDMELWGQTSKPTMYSIYLCQLHEDVVPGSVENGNIVSYAPMQDPAQVEFWQSMIKRFVYSPLSKIDDGYGNKKIKILKQYKVNIDPTSTTESDPDPHVKTMKLFYRFNRQCNFEWEFASGGGQSIANMNDADWVQEAGWNKTQVHPNARLFVMVRASNYTKTPLASVSNANTPSMSWVMRSSYLINN